MTTTPAKRPSSWRLCGSRFAAVSYVLPAATLYLCFVLLPTLHTAYLSFFNWDGVSPGRWAGLGNYREVLGNPALRNSLVHALILIVFFAGIPIGLGLLLAALLARIPRGLTLFRVMLFLPQVLPLVAVGIVWRWMYTQDGVINQAFRAIGLTGVTQAWLGSFSLALPAVGLVGTWYLCGLCMVLFFAGIQKIDASLYEAARIDGARWWREFTAVTVPGLRGEIRVAATITVVAALASFDIVYVTTNGGPGDRTTVPGLLVYRLAFDYGQVGVASTIAILLTTLMLLFVALIMRLTSD